MGIFHRPSLSSAQEGGGSDTQQAGVSPRPPHRSSFISSRQHPGSSSMSFRHNSSGRYSSNAFEGGIGAEVNVPNSRFSRYLCGCCGGTLSCRKPAWMAPNSTMSINSKRIIRSRTWKFLMILFYGFVLFGAQINQLWAPVGDVAFNIISLFTFGFCVLEMALRILAETSYFQFGISPFFQNKLYSIGGNDNSNICAFGSFLFWCDLVSTGVILYDISWINKGPFEQQTVEIQLDALGFPVCTIGFCI